MDGDDELAQIRAKRMAEMRGVPSGASGASSALPSGLMPSKGPQGSGDDTEKLAQMEEMRRTMLIQLLDNSARERLARISMVKQEKARAVEDLLIRMAQSGQLRGKINENMLIDLLGQLNEQQSAKVESKIKITRRNVADSDDDEDLLAGL
ncbi:PDCD5-related protein [Obelidium mucronatum]|nr:PDCD5-related protein [Obelidium mucronatum]